MLRSSRVLSGEPYKHPVANARAQEVLAARKATASATKADVTPNRPSLVTPYRRSARIAAQKTVPTYMNDGSAVRVPRDLPATVTVRCSLAATNTYADHEYGAGTTTTSSVTGPWSDEVVKINLLAFKSLVDKAYGTKPSSREEYHRRLYYLHRFVHHYGPRFLWKYEGLRSSVVDKAREFSREFHKICGLTPDERNDFRSILRSIISYWT
jgi:hypothetical protein